MILLPAAERARDIASIFELFRRYDRDEQIADAAAELKTLSSQLRDLDKSVIARNGVIDSIELFDDLELLQHSLAYTLQDVWTILGQMPDQAIGHDYRTAWKAIQKHCTTGRQQSFAKRLSMYSLFARALVRQLNRQQAPVHLIADMRDDILTLRRAQLSDRRLITASEAINDLTAVTTRPPISPPPRDPPTLAPPAPMRQPRSAERVRPPPHRTMSPTESNISWDSVQRPSISSPPQSPMLSTTTFSNTGGTTSSTDANAKERHWASQIFSDMPATDIYDDKNRDKMSQCFPLNPEDGASLPDPDEYDKLLQIKFGGDFRCIYWLRDRDYRTKIVCQWPSSRSRKTMSACLPLSELHTRREGAMLYLCRAVAGLGQNTAWAAFKFPTIEYLIMFHCTFLALRSYDGRQRIGSVFDHEIQNERTYFSARIRDNGYRHALRVLRDKGTGCLRLEASVLDGPLKNTPIWTAFITHFVTSPRWVKDGRSKNMVILSDLKRHIFSSQYTPDLSQGVHFLDFELAKDASGFKQVITDFGKRYRDEASKSSTRK